MSKEIFDHKVELDEIVLSGAELKKHVGSEEAAKLEKSLNGMKEKYSVLSAKCNEQLSKMEEALPLVQRFQDNHKILIGGLQRTEQELYGKESSGSEADKQLEVMKINPPCSCLFLCLCCPPLVPFISHGE